jgi:hypothetical protein
MRETRIFCKGKYAVVYEIKKGNMMSISKTGKIAGKTFYQRCTDSNRRNVEYVTPLGDLGDINRPRRDFRDVLSHSTDSADPAMV